MSNEPERKADRSLRFYNAIAVLAHGAAKSGLLPSEALVGAISFACWIAVPEMQRDQFLQMAGEFYDLEMEAKADKRAKES